jgi:gamma-glutamyl hercynylcysteine S-oxide synthase
MREELALGLDEARERTLRLTDIDEIDLTRVHDPLMGPLVWDLAHVGQQEDLWLLREGEVEREAVLPQQVDRLYDAFLHPRQERPSLPLLTATESRSFISDVRGRALDKLEKSEDLFPFAMVTQHEQQHDETMLATHQLRSGVPLLGGGATLPPGRQAPHDSVLVPGGEFVLGVNADDEPWSLDNERPAHVVDIPAFRIGRFPVTNSEWQAFIDDDGYNSARWWTVAGWQHRTDAELTAPRFWRADGSRCRFGILEDVPPDEPVQHICYYEAEAYAAWSGARLPTETEWEKACVWDPTAGRRRRWPWGARRVDDTLANLGGEALRPAPVGAYPGSASAYGAEQMIGDVWEWTSSQLGPWPGFVPMLYATYSEPFFGQNLRVLRGGSWAVGAPAIRPSFRNWDLPIRRQIFSGVRLAWDV